MPNPAIKFPFEIWQIVVSHLPPREWLKLRSTSKAFRTSITETQSKQANLWAKILPKELPEMKTDQGEVIDLVLVGRIKDIGKAGQKPYIFLGTTPYGKRPPNWRGICHLMDDMNQQVQHHNRTGADHGTFCLNTEGFLSAINLPLDGFVQLSNKESRDLLEGEIYALRYNTPGLHRINVETRPGFIKGFTELIIQFEDAFFKFVDFDREYKA
ncbi:uncharacterized protein F5Z01DRAFT_669126 [Emericellopsis atlantica]|uniref:F-box domain-containing protein n=1 Tax=Emericellopsis atlantica TaxID=2614577 RepID=A0A9P7ZCV5_9HYPO|nr:uncharacterized protein F5Z01DRAFT_669126 [Emericellopsis atlantica]KAG9249472.1 hypothetical protein F5Z01DRAFT_669126 [Emericellopsis atlantica]